MAARVDAGSKSAGLPKWAKGIFDRQLTQKYEIDCRLEPCMIHGDFNGDGKKDLAVLIKQRNTRVQGIAVLHSSGTAGNFFILGAGHEIGNGGKDWSWMDVWSLYKRGPVEQSTDESVPPNLVGDALLVEKSESASAVVYFDGKSYSWYQQGD